MNGGCKNLYSISLRFRLMYFDIFYFNNRVKIDIWTSKIA